LNFLFLSEIFFPHGGGAEFATYLYASLLGKQGHNVIVVTNKYGEEGDYSKNKDFAVYRLPLFSNTKSGKFSILRRVDVLFSSFMRKLLRWSDIVYIPRYWFSAILVVSTFNKPVITHLHDYIPVCPLAILYDCSNNRVCERHGSCSIQCIYAFEQGKPHLADAIASVALNRSLRLLFRKFIQHSNAIICVSDAQRRIIVENVPSLRAKTWVVHNPLPDLSIVPLHGRHFGYFGGANLMKGFGILVQALKHLAVSSTVVDAANFKEPSNFEEFRKLGIILHRKIAREKMDAFYRQIHAVVFPSLCPEPSPYVVTEAILRGRIVISSNVGGIPEQVRDCRGVLLFDVGRYDKLAEKMEYVNSLDEEEVVDLGTENRGVFLKSFSNKRTIAEFTEVVDRIT
jgi:glycosyltransferase involved in cell wall biosynthesis